MSACEDKTEKVFDVFAHHSIEIDDSENHLIAPGVAEYYFNNINPYLQEKLRDDSILKVTLDGTVVKNMSFSKILVDNGLESLLFGHMGSGFEPRSYSHEPNFCC